MFYRVLEYNKSKFGDEPLLKQAITQTYLLFQLIFCDSIASDIKCWPLSQPAIPQSRCGIFLFLQPKDDDHVIQLTQAELLA